MEKRSIGCLGHIIFLALHLVAFCAFWPLLFITVPLHLIYTVIAARKSKK